MAECVYILTLPGGGQIELPATFGTLDPEPEIENLYNKYITEKDDEAKQEALTALKAIIRARTPDEIHGNTINSIINNSQSVDDIYTNLNEIINKLGSYNNLQTALRKYIKGGKWKNGKNNRIEELKKGLNQKRSKAYFQGIGLQGVLGATSLAQEKYRIYSKNEQNKEFGFPNDLTKNLITFLKALNTKYKDTRTHNIIYGVNGEFMGKAWSSEDVVMYQLDDDLSLFLGLFKREAVKVDKAQLLPIILEINKVLKTKKNGKLDIAVNVEDFDIEKFFMGEVINNKVHISQFEELLSAATDKNLIKQLDAIVTLVAQTISPTSTTLVRAIKSLAWQLWPLSYGKNNLFQKLESEKLIKAGLKVEQDYKDKLLPFDEMTSAVRESHFAQKEIIQGDVYKNSIKELIIGRDIVKFPEGKYGVYAIVTDIFPYSNGAMLYGRFKNQYGQIETVKHLFKNGELEYRKREAPIAEYNDDEIITPNDGTLVYSKSGFNQTILKQILSKGDLVNGDLVIGIYPGFIRVQGPKEKKNVYFSQIYSIVSRKVKESIAAEETINPKHFVQVNNGEDLSRGDYFLYQTKNKKFYKQILFADEENVYAWVAAEGKEPVVTATKRTGLTGLKNAIGELTLSEINSIKNEVKKISSTSAKMSTFTEPTKARKGDFFYYMDGVIAKYGKVLNDDKVVLTNADVGDKIIKDISALPAGRFFTTRDISSKFAIFTNRANNYKIEFKSQKDHPLDVEMVYIVPPNANLDKLTTLTNGYGNIGGYDSVENLKFRIVKFINEKLPNTAESKKLIKDIENSDSFKLDNIRNLAENLPEKDAILFVKFINDIGMDVTAEMLEILDKQGMKVFGRRISSSSYKYERDLESLTEIKYFNNLDTQTKKDLQVVVTGAYFSLFKKDYIDNHIYRIMSVEDDVVTAHLSRMSGEGEIITTEIQLSLDEMLEKGNEDMANEGSIGKFYMQDGNNKMGTVFKEINKLSDSVQTESRPTTNKAINTLIKKLKGYIKGSGITVELVPHKGNFNPGEKAKIQTTSDGKSAILISQDIGQTEDVLHEFLHLFLTPLRYKHPEVYNALIKSIVEDENLNVTDAEEIFVKYVSAKMESQGDFLENFANLQSFVKGIQTVLSDVDNNFVISDQDNPVTLLKTPLMDLFNIDRHDNTNPLMNYGMIVTEPAMRQWMKNNNIALNCA